MAKKYIDADDLKIEIKHRIKLMENEPTKYAKARIDEANETLSAINVLQQDETQVDKMLCSQVWWEEQGWIMIPPDVTIEGIDSLLRQIKKKLKEQPEVDLEKEYTEFVVSDPVYSKLVNGVVGKSIARHFYELGLKAKEENK